MAATSETQPADRRQERAEADWRPKYNPWLIAVVVAMAAFMEVLDTSIANVALPYMAGSLGAGVDESTWILTSYLVSNAVVLPMTAWFANTFGRKRFFMICVVIFTVSSVFCGMASSLAFLIIFRVLQGGGGGGLQPMAQAILADTFPPEKRGLAFSLYGVTAVLAPSLGPTLGGWITDNYSWRWIFFINLPVGLITLFLIHRLVEDPPYVAKARRARIKVDYIGISLLVVGLGCLQVLLDKGEQEDWFGSNLIVTLTVLSVISLVALVIWEWQQDQPVLDVRLFKNFNYASSNLMMFMLGLILFGSIVMLPQFTQGLLGYTAETSGMVLSPGGFVILCLLPFVGRLLSVVPAKLLILFGWCVLAFSLFYSTHINAQLDFRHAAMLRIVQSLGLPFLFIPVTTLAYIGIPKEKNNAVAGTINLMRNLGSSFGTSIVTTLLAERTQRHQNYLVANITPSNPLWHSSVQSLSQQLHSSGLSAGQAQMQAYGRLYRSLSQQAQTLAYIDTYWLLAMGACTMAVLALFARRNNPKASAGSVAAH